MDCENPSSLLPKFSSGPHAMISFQMSFGFDWRMDADTFPEDQKKFLSGVWMSFSGDS